MRERQATHKSLVEGVAGLELALTRCQGDLSRVESDSREHVTFVERVRDRSGASFFGKTLSSRMRFDYTPAGVETQHRCDPITLR
jgi:hypothetical protein